MTTRLPLVLASLCGTAFSAVQSGHATADWLADSASCQPGKPLQTAVKLVVEPEWHTYWENPGEGGMKLSVTWELPAGWTAGPLLHPVPKSFMTGDLPGFGYEGTVLFPVTFTAPADFSGSVKLKGKVSWLTCNDAKCIPGDAELELTVQAGAPSATPAAKELEAALAKVPQPAVGSILEVKETPKTLQLTIHTAADASSVNPETAEVFPATPDAIANGAKIQFAKAGPAWTAEVPKSEYATAAIRELTLVIAGKAPQAPVSLTWKAK